jgi:DNA-binding GntR family transcriptional regulator
VSETVDALHIKAVLEALAARLSGTKLSECLSRLRDYSGQIRDAALREDWVDYQNQNQLFHRLIVESSGNQILLNLWGSLAFDVRTRFIMDYLHIMDPNEPVMEHEKIIQAIEEKDTGRVADLLSSHANSLVRHLMQQKAHDSADRKETEPVT